jgi:hypothetical protein
MTTTEQLSRLNVALNEARFVAFHFDLYRRIASVELRVLTLPSDGPAPKEVSVELRLFPVGRIAASYVGSDGHVKRLRIDDLSDAVRSFGGQPIYGWEFFNPPSANLAVWENRLSLDWRGGDTGLTHTLHLFQESNDRKLDLCLWFDDVEIRDEHGGEMAIEAVIASGKQWWDSVFSDDSGTRGSGIYPIKK